MFREKPNVFRKEKPKHVKVNRYPKQPETKINLTYAEKAIGKPLEIFGEVKKKK